MRPPTAAGGVLLTGETSTATETTVNEQLLQFYSTEEVSCKKTSTRYVSYGSSVWNLRAASYCRKAIDTKSGEIMTFDPGGSQECFNDWGGGDTTIPSPGRPPKQPLPGIELHHPLHSRQDCPEFNSFHQEVGQISPREGLFSCRSLPKRGQICDILATSQSLKDSQGRLRACPVLGSWRALLCGEVIHAGAAG